MVFLNRETSEETKGVLTEDGDKPIAFTPNTVFVIAKDDYSGLCAKREKILILFDS